jgi:hypothetical protein
LARNETDGRDALVAGWPRLAGGRTKAVGLPSSDGHEAFVSVVLGKGLPFYGSCGCNGQLTQPGIWCGQHGARQWSAREVSAAQVRLWKKMAKWRHDVVRS